RRLRRRRREVEGDAAAGRVRVCCDCEAGARYIRLVRHARGLTVLHTADPSVAQRPIYRVPLTGRFIDQANVRPEACIEPYPMEAPVIILDGGRNDVIIDLN